MTTVLRLAWDDSVDGSGADVRRFRPARLAPLRHLQLPRKDRGHAVPFAGPVPDAAVGSGRAR